MPSIDPHRALRHGDRGNDVRALQSALNRRLAARGLERYRVREDGEYGPATARAASKAVWALGGLLATVRSVAADRGGRLSVGSQRMILTPGRREREQLERAESRHDGLASANRAARRRARSTTGSRRAQCVARFARWVGTTERPPGSNGGPGISDWQREFGFGRVAWCGIACGHFLKLAGVQGVTARIAGVALIEDDARARRGPFRGWTTDRSQVLAGDLAVIGGYGVHVEMVERVLPGGVLQTIGGNTSPGRGGSQSNGGGVWRRQRGPGEVRGIAQVNFPG